MRLPLSRLTAADGKLSIELAAIVLLFVVLDCALFAVHHSATDWAPLWVAGGLAWTDPVLAYDISVVTGLQGPIIGPGSDRPFIYPPTALMLFAPLALLPFRLSFAAFVLVSLFLLERSSSKLGARPVLLLVAPPLVLAAIAGQPTLLVAAIVIAALLVLPTSERRAGLLLGIAAVLKPPLLVLAPFALAGGRHWRALESAGITVAVLIGASILWFGIGAWQAWFAALPEFQALIISYEPLLRNTITPHATMLRFGYDPLWVTLGVALIAVTLVFLAFARSSDVALRLVMLVAGALLVAPYGMNYELAALAPVVAAMPLRRVRDMVIPVVWASSLFVTAAVVGLVAVYGWAIWKLFRPAGLFADNLPVERRVDIAA